MQGPRFKLRTPQKKKKGFESSHGDAIALRLLGRIRRPFKSYQAREISLCSFHVNDIPSFIQKKKVLDETHISFKLYK